MNYRRWNFEIQDDKICVCKDEHEKGQACMYRELSSVEVLHLIEDMRSQLIQKLEKEK